jgi:hypothetical protein
LIQKQTAKTRAHGWAARSSKKSAYCAGFLYYDLK